MNPHLFNLPPQSPLYIGRQDFVVHYAAQKCVLHLGCVDQGMSQTKLERGDYMHARLDAVCTSLWGIDNDREGVEWMRSQGWEHVMTADVEDLGSITEQLTEPFDLLLLTEVIEHLDNPGRFLTSIRPLFLPHTELLITTPNSTSLSNIMRIFSGQEQVHPDHNFWFSYGTLHSLLKKYGYQITFCARYSQYDYTRPWVGKFLPSPDRVDSGIPGASANVRINDQPAKARKRDPLGWISANAQALLFGWLLQRAPFFADGLILIAKPIPEGT